MRKKWLLLAIIFLLGLLIMALYVSRNQWVAYVLRRTVSSRSKGQISLNFKKIDVGVFSKTLAIYEPALSFKNVYFNKALGSTLKKADFQKLILTNISLWDLLRYKQFICDNLVLEKPAFNLGESSLRTKTKTLSFDPVSLIRVLQKHEITQLNFQFLIRSTRINFGKIKLNEGKRSAIYGSAQYNISIEYMGTIKAARDTLHPLNFEKLEVAIRALHRYSAVDRMDIKLDSAFYSSRTNILLLSGLQINALDKNLTKPPIAQLFLRWTRIRGLSTKKQKKTGKMFLQLNDIKVVGGSYTFKSHHKKQEEKSTSDLLNRLFSTYDILFLDSLSLRHIQLFRINNEHDTLLKLKRINVELRKAWTTKRIIHDPLTSLHYKSLSVSYRELDFGGKKSPLSVHSGEAEYSSGNEQLIVNNLNVRTRCKTDTSLTTRLYTKKLSVDNLSDKRLLEGKNQLLVIDLDSPVIDWRHGSSCKQKPIAFPAVLKHFRIEKIRIKNGNFGYASNNNLKLNISGINFYANNLQGTILSGTHAAIHYDSLFFNAENSRLDVANTRQLVETGKLLWDKRFFKISKLHFLQTGSTEQDSLKIRSLTLTRPRLNSLVFKQTLIAQGAYLYKVNFSENHQDSVKAADTLPPKHWNSFIKIPFKTAISYVRFRKSRFSLASRQPGRDFKISSEFDLKLHGFRMGYDSLHLISQPRQWEATLRKTKIRQNDLTAQSGKIVLNSNSGTVQIQNTSLRQLNDSSLQFGINIPYINVLSLDYVALMRSDSLVFGKCVVQRPQAHLQLTDFLKDTIKGASRWTFVYDSIKFKQAQLQIKINKAADLQIVNIKNLNLLYHPNLRHPVLLPEMPQNLMKYWDFTIKKISFSDARGKFRMVADRVAIQSSENRLSIKRITGTNFSLSMLNPQLKTVYSYFLINNMSLNDINLSAGKNNALYIKKWSVPELWVNIINNNSAKRKKSLPFLRSNFFSRYTHILNSIHVDSSIFNNVNISYQYDNMNKLINIKNLGISTNDIQLGNRLPGKLSDALFGTMFINLNDRSIISGDSMYTFRTRDIRVNLAKRKISFDSITITPRFNRKDFFARAEYQTDRITLYGKSAMLDNFDPDDLLNNHFLHFGSLRLNNFSLRFERDMRYPRREVVKPMIIGLLSRIPYKFKIDSVQLHNSLISYFEYVVKSKNPGIFFIDNFDALAENMTNDLSRIDSGMVLTVHGTGKLMKQANLDFTLVMPYFAPNRQWWFSAEAGQIDLTQFNLLTENVLGITIISGKGSLQVPMITGNETFAKGSVHFMYKNLKLRLYSRKKAQKSKGFFSPFANFMMNNILINNNNPPFLGHMKKGIVYYERNPEKSFVNYLWKSNLSGILSTLGFNNKQQREGKRENKKLIKTEDKNKQKPKKDE